MSGALEDKCLAQGHNVETKVLLRSIKMGFFCFVRLLSSIGYIFQYNFATLTCPNPVNTKHLYNIYTTSAQRLRRGSSFV